jgi:hypothetical protein
MIQRWIILGMLILTVLPVFLVVEARAEAVSISVTRSSVTVKMDLELQENLTGLPVFSALVGPSNSTEVESLFSQPINSAIQKSVSGASLSGLALRVETSNNTGVYTLDENYTMVISGANTNSGSSITSDLGFVSMNVTGPLQLEGVELNLVGPALILPALEAKASEISNLAYYIGGSHPSTAFIPEQTTKEFSLLDFTWVTPVSTWTSSQNILRHSTSWAYDPTTPQYNLTIGLPSPEGLLTRAWTVIYNPSFNVTVPANAWINGNTVRFDISAPSETIMPTIIAASVLIAIVTVFLDRRLTGNLRFRKKR